MPMDPSVQELPRSQACVGMCTHYPRLLLHWRAKLVMVNLLHSSATIAVNLSVVLILIKSVLSYLPRKRWQWGKKRAECAHPSQTGPGLDCGSLNHLQANAPHSSGQAGQDYHVTTSSTATSSLVAYKEFNGVGCCLLAYNRDFKE